MSGPHLPGELWMDVAWNLRGRKKQSELRYMWNSIRLVSKIFREIVEEIFKEEHLPKTWLHWNFSVHQNPTATHVPLQIVLREQQTEFGFGGFVSNHPERAIFVEKVTHFKDDIDMTTLDWPPKPGPVLPHQSPVISAISERKLSCMNRAPPYPGWHWTTNLFVTQVRGGFNDILMPDLQVSESLHEISCDWKRMYSRFFDQPQLYAGEEQPTTCFPRPPSQLETFIQSHPVVLDYVHHCLRQKAAKDYRDYCRLAIKMFEEMEHLFERCPIRSWQKAVGLPSHGNPDAIIPDETRVLAVDSAIGLDLEGRMDFETPLKKLKDVEVRRNKKDRDTQRCDLCRVRGIVCERNCKGKGTASTLNLANFNGHKNVSTDVDPSHYVPYGKRGKLIGFGSVERPPWDHTRLRHPALTHLSYLTFPAQMFRPSLTDMMSGGRQYIYAMLYEYNLIRPEMERCTNEEQEAITDWEAVQESLLQNPGE